MFYERNAADELRRPDAGLAVEGDQNVALTVTSNGQPFAAVYPQGNSRTDELHSFSPLSILHLFGFIKK